MLSYDYTYYYYQMYYSTNSVIPWATEQTGTGYIYLTK